MIQVYIKYLYSQITYIISILFMWSEYKMTFEDEIKDFVKTIPPKLEHIDTEETTKIAFITPFLRLMGYDTTNPAEVRAEGTSSCRWRRS